MQVENILFLIVFVFSIFLFVKNLRKIISNIKLGKDINRSDNKSLRLKNPITGWRFYSQASGKLTETTVFVNKKLRLINPSFDVS